MPVIDSDQHLFEPRDMWSRYADPAFRDEALAIIDDAVGHPWLTWRGRRLGLADVQWPGETDAIGARRERIRSGLPPEARYDEILPRDYWDPDARIDPKTVPSPGAILDELTQGEIDGEAYDAEWPGRAARTMW